LQGQKKFVVRQNEIQSLQTPKEERQHFRSPDREAIEVTKRDKTKSTIKAKNEVGTHNADDFSEKRAPSTKKSIKIDPKKISVFDEICKKLENLAIVQGDDTGNQLSLLTKKGLSKKGNKTPTLGVSVGDLKKKEGITHRKQSAVCEEKNNYLDTVLNK
jgi:hypothetical protein